MGVSPPSITPLLALTLNIYFSSNDEHLFPVNSTTLATNQCGNAENNLSSFWSPMLSDETILKKMCSERSILL